MCFRHRTRHGEKKCSCAPLKTCAPKVLKRLRFKEGDSLVGVAKTGGCHDIMLFSNLGKAIRFNEYWEGSSEAEESEDDQEIDAHSGEEGDAAESSTPKANKGVRPSGRGSGGCAACACLMTAAL